MGLDRLEPGLAPGDWPLLKSYGASNFNEAADSCIINNDAGVQAYEFMKTFWCGNLRSSPTPATLTQLGSGTQKVFEGGLSVMDYVLSKMWRQQFPSSLTSLRWGWRSIRPS